MNKAVFLDRDGTLNVDKGYTYKLKKLELIPGVIEGMKILAGTDYKLIIITNQQGIGKGMYNEEDAIRFNNVLKELIEKMGGRIDGVYFCPHMKEDNCECRKPKIGMLLKAKQDFDLNLEKCFFIGDTSLDMGAGKNANCKTILLKTGYDGEKKFEVKPDFIVEDLLEAVRIVKNGKN
ncbi:HAD family hydrolase [Candidatus Woesearchaeota archaeon]|nr:HAD family hydrolase [Candidatus Woesearchaeota archaeon]